MEPEAGIGNGPNMALPRRVGSAGAMGVLMAACYTGGGAAPETTAFSGTAASGWTEEPSDSTGVASSGGAQSDEEADTSGESGSSGSSGGTTGASLDDLVGDAALPAFPGAEGHGAVSMGGRGGAVLYVDTLEDGPGEGTLRWALTQPYPRTIVFSVGGIIDLDGPIRIEGEAQSFLTVAGQTAPGSGITLRGGYLQFQSCHDVVIRYLRIRPGVNHEVWERDALTGFGVQRFIVDHVSAGWASDEAISVNAAESYGKSAGVTIQRCLMTENDPAHNTGSILSTGSLTETFDGGEIEDGFSSHHNAFVHISHRFPNVRGKGTYEIINNVVHNWNSRLVSVSLGSQVDHLNNYYRVGPMHAGDGDLQPFLCKHKLPDGEEARIYTSGNLVMPDFHTDPDADNWYFWEGYETSYSQHLEMPEEMYRKLERNPAPLHPVTVHSAQAAFVSVTDDVGANARIDADGAWVENLDAVDRAYLDDMLAGTGPTAYAAPDSHTYPPQDAGRPYADVDRDGMADVWETAHGLNPADPEDGNAFTLSPEGYTNLEVFLNGSAGG